MPDEQWHNLCWNGARCKMLPGHEKGVDLASCNCTNQPHIYEIGDSSVLDDPAVLSRVYMLTAANRSSANAAGLAKQYALHM
jgi:hypothetical protein